MADQVNQVKIRFVTSVSKALRYTNVAGLQPLDPQASLLTFGCLTAPARPNEDGTIEIPAVTEPVVMTLKTLREFRDAITEHLDKRSRIVAPGPGTIQ